MTIRPDTVLKPRGGGEALRGPYAGFIGDYQAIQVLAPGAYGLPQLGWTPNGLNFGFAASGDVFTMQGFDIPYILVHLAHQSRLLRVEVRQPLPGLPWQLAYEMEFVGRNSATTSFFALPWDGIVPRGAMQFEAPNGEYELRVSVLKALGDKNNPAHWETWTSPHFTVLRP